MSLFGLDKREKCALEREIARRDAEIQDLKSSKHIPSSDQVELEFLRKAIKPYIAYSYVSGCVPGRYTVNCWCHHYITGSWEADKKRIKEHLLYIAVLEGEMGPEKTASAKEKLAALKALKCEDA